MKKRNETIRMLVLSAMFAALCCVSKPRFFALFKKFTGASPVVYKNAACTEAAAKYLIAFPNRSVEEIAYEFRFSSPVYFARLFKKRFGVSPAAYRKARLFSGL